MCERELETVQNCNILTTTLMAISVSNPFSRLLNRGHWDPASLGAGFLYRILSPTRLIPNWFTSCLHPGYIIVQHPPSSCVRHNFALIQSVHGQGYNILTFLDRIHQLFTQVHFLFWQPGRVVGQYTTLSGMQSTPFLLSLLGSLWPGVVEPDRIQIARTRHARHC